VDLKLPPAHPLAVFTADGKITGSVQFICESNINAALQSAAKKMSTISQNKRS
jgi:hypothetical protein